MKISLSNEALQKQLAPTQVELNDAICAWLKNCFLQKLILRHYWNNDQKLVALSH